MVNLKDVRVDFPVDTAHNALCHIVANCGIDSVLFALGEIVAAQQSVQSDGLEPSHKISIDCGCELCEKYFGKNRRR